jgi:hypothetical protein
MKRINHSDYADFDFLLFGISSSVDEFRICWLLNRLFQINLGIENEVVLHHSKTNQESVFCHFRYEKLSVTNSNLNFVNMGLPEHNFDESSVVYQLIGNRHPSGNLLPEHQRIDYLLSLRGEGIDEVNPDSILTQLRSCDEIQAAFHIDVESLKSKNNLIF